MYLHEFSKPGKGKVTIDLDLVSRFYELSESNRTEVYQKDGAAIELKMPYEEFSAIMRKVAWRDKPIRLT